MRKNVSGYQAPDDAQVIVGADHATFRRTSREELESPFHYGAWKTAAIRFAIVSGDLEPVAPTDLAKNRAVIEIPISVLDHIPEQLVDDVQDG